MNTNEIIIKVKVGLNKLDSQDYDNLENWLILMAFNKVQYEFVRKQTLGYNVRKQGDESSKVSIDDLQVLLTDIPLTIYKRKGYYESELLPSDYLYWKRVIANSSTECCASKNMRVYLSELANVENMLADEFKKPSFEWGETFATLIGNRIRIYTNDEFDLHGARLIYYREPRYVEKQGVMNVRTEALSLADVDCEFKRDIAEILVTLTISELASNIEMYMNYNVNKNETMSTM